MRKKGSKNFQIKRLSQASDVGVEQIIKLSVPSLVSTTGCS